MKKITVEIRLFSLIKQICYYRSISNSHRVAKFTGFVNVFISFYYQINIFFAEFIIAFFCPSSWVVLKQLDPSPSRATDQ